jgi:hypothetical protein
MLPNFVHEQRLFANPVGFTGAAFYGGFIFELLLAFTIWMALYAIEDLRAFTSDHSVVITSPRVFMTFTSVGIYGIRVAMFIAIIRRNRSPQTLEWIVTLIGLGVTLFGIMFSSLLLSCYAGVQGYYRCPTDSFRNRNAVFVLHKLDCSEIRQK